MYDELGENLQREWNEDEFGTEIWDALQTLKGGHTSAILELKNLAERGSSLAMMYLGSAYINGRPNLAVNVKIGEAWLRQSACAGSIESKFGLAKHLLQTDRVEEAFSILESLSSSYYSPAAYVIGFEYFRGRLVERNISVAVEFLQFAEEIGHIRAKLMLSHIYMRSGLGVARFLQGVKKWVEAAVPMIIIGAKHSNSDRIRT